MPRFWSNRGSINDGISPESLVTRIENVYETDHDVVRSWYSFRKCHRSRSRVTELIRESLVTRIENVYETDHDVVRSWYSFRKCHRSRSRVTELIRDSYSRSEWPENLVLIQSHGTLTDDIFGSYISSWLRHGRLVDILNPSDQRLWRYSIIYRTTVTPVASVLFHFFRPPETVSTWWKTNTTKSRRYKLKHLLKVLQNWSGKKETHEAD